MSENFCLICNKPIPATRTSGNVKYCSAKCARQAERNKRMDYIKKRTNAWRTDKRYKIYQCYDFKCAICGWQAMRELFINGKAYPSHGNELHHIVPASESGGEGADNIICLCPNHHKMANLGILSREYLKSLIKGTPEHDPAENSCADAIAKMIFDEEEETEEDE